MIPLKRTAEDTYAVVGQLVDRMGASFARGVLTELDRAIDRGGLQIQRGRQPTSIASVILAASTAALVTSASDKRQGKGDR